MASRKLILGGASAAALGVRLAGLLRGRWWIRRPLERKQLPAPANAGTPEARDTPDAAETPAPDLAAAAASLRAASRSLGAAPAEPATAAAPDLSIEDVGRLRGDLRRELERLAKPDVKASRTGLSAPPQG